MSDNAHEYTVSELSGALKRTVEAGFGHVRVRGEISGLKVAASGHAYLALKDENALLDGVMWKGSLRALGFKPEDGLEVLATGKLTTYPGRSKYQIVIERMEPAGAGALMALLEARKAKLAAEGLFEAARKKPLPTLPRVIGVVTSPTGAVIRDILHRLEDRFPSHVLLWGVQVQGETAAAQIAAAISGFDALPEKGGAVPRPDLLIVARGGGAIEDLWAFNEEAVVRAAAACSIPLISAVGHETDTTLIDFVSDRRAPTPTAAAEMAVPVRAELQADVQDYGARLLRALTRAQQNRRERLQGVAQRLPSPRTLLALRQQRADEWGERLPRALVANISHWRARLLQHAGALRPVLLMRPQEKKRDRLETFHARLHTAAARIQERNQQRLAQAARLLDSLNPDAVLERGYAVVESPDGHVISRAEAARLSSALTLRFQDGKVDVTVGGNTGAPAARTTAAATKNKGTQGTLL